MDSVLTRKLFRDKYFQLHKPKNLIKAVLHQYQNFKQVDFTPQRKNYTRFYGSSRIIRR